MKKIIGFGISLLFPISNVYAVDVGVGAKVGTNGIGIDLSVGLTRAINLRLSAAAIDIDDEDETFEVGDSGAEGDIDAELDALLSEIESDAEDDLDDLEVWPVLAIGVNYAF